VLLILNFLFIFEYGSPAIIILSICFRALCLHNLQAIYSTASLSGLETDEVAVCVAVS